MPYRSYALLILGLIVAFGVVVHQKERGLDLVINERSQIAALLRVAQARGVALDQPAKSAPCVVEGSFPDHGCTPGDVFPDAGPESICEAGYSKSARSVSIGLKREIYDAYGIAYPQPKGSYELDHLVPLELGGSNDRSNLWPEAASSLSASGAVQTSGQSSAPGFHEKDIVENYLHEQVCAGVIDLPAAQKQIATDWVAVYEALSPETVASLKQQFPSWTSHP